MCKERNMQQNPRLIFWEITRSCNLECSHCRASAEKKRSPVELSTSEAKGFIDQIASFSSPILVFSGGEPLIREDIYELLNYAGQAGLKAALATNATMITEDVAKQLKETGVKIVSVSVYGATASAHDNFCGDQGAFEKTVSGMKNLKKADIPVQINTTITKRNLDQIVPLNEFALNLGAVAYHVFFLVPTGRGKAIEGDEISPTEYEETLNELCELEEDSPLNIKATCAPHYYRILHQRGMHKHKRPPREHGGLNARTKGCLAGQSVCFVSYKGEVFGCGYLPVAAGDIKAENFKDIWFKSELFGVLRDGSKLHGRCGICEFKNVCSGCRARAYAANGDYLAEEPYCIYQPSAVTT